MKEESIKIFYDRSLMKLKHERKKFKNNKKNIKYYINKVENLLNK